MQKLTHNVLHPGFVVELRGVDLARHTLDPDRFAEIVTAMDEFGVVVLPGQNLTDQQLLAFGERFGPVYKGPGNPARKKTAPPGVAEISNLGPDGELVPPAHETQKFSDGNRFWHSDLSFTAGGAAHSMLCALEVPAYGGETEFADTARALETLPAAIRDKIAGLKALHSLRFSRAKTGYVDPFQDKRQKPAAFSHPLVYTNAKTGRRSLYIGSHAGQIEGLDEESSTVLLDELLSEATQVENQYSHRWAVGDLVIWDNRRVLHRRGDRVDPMERRSMRRVTVLGDLTGVAVDENPAL